MEPTLLHIWDKNKPLRYVVILLVKYFCSACDLAEYEIYGECCPMCSPGTRVYGHCTMYTSTSCVPCDGFTFTDKPNGLSDCIPCTMCDQGLGLKTVKECTASSDTVCGALEGNYCTDPYEGGCRAAKEHTTCKPGDFIKHPGTLSSDTVCDSCPENSYSNGSSEFCKKHTNCETKGLPTVKPGDSVSDSKCGEKNSGHLIAVIIGPIIAAVLTTATVAIFIF
ncbi:tumor necrosis factor receptor superfamily member 14-like [Scleropages formosus]|uniref:Tumor necrosis factor receptor superfamily member 14-like n=1 Tax=Scleropages formosus TaxID=113540 RepID=A0A8C9SUT5_SCLFO|nr:tumor necrosis factor receptor superfamily member 14-like [Scleropages formosus]XP_029105625.1 tumor necrosis factor receptor superfamily member 14-like [Scleropages formosus]